MPLPDTIHTTAAAFYGLALSGLKKETKAEKNEEKVEKTEPQKQNPIAPTPQANTEATPANWSDASPSTVEDFMLPARFLQSYLRGSATKSADRDEVAMVLASRCKGTLVAKVGVNYRQMVDVFCCIQQSLL